MEGGTDLVKQTETVEEEIGINAIADLPSQDQQKEQQDHAVPIASAYLWAWTGAIESQTPLHVHAQPDPQGQVILIYPLPQFIAQ